MSPLCIFFMIVTAGFHTCRAATVSQFQQQLLSEHNRLRAFHSAGPLRWNPTISKWAQQWAQEIAKRNKLEHRPNNKYGENLYAVFGTTTISAAQVVRSWYQEKKDFTYGRDPGAEFSKVGHFTQLVWKSTKEVGCGAAVNGKNVYVVCNYSPPGNYRGQYARNVSPN
ncbi:uncharacterized protein LOC129757751 [Uranotaenia lowii]|uniref:uncharacterized protein LOC129757751 n=1 Tax=Uranotaenia lowii TaxID=190385 RepID=UPI0024788752|nr:uncharacterized protein LOC129757751 [Uranotaenia lowii]